MEDITKRKFVAGGKVLAGGTRMILAVITGGGGGLVGGFLKNHGMKRTAMELAKVSFEGGKKMMESGLSELRQ